MKEVIVAFFRWFTLMGKKGISVGDWVEIEGVQSDRDRIAQDRAPELGNWTDTGHPTDRRVSFSNSFAMEHHYLNFSTTGQWLWDEIQVVLSSRGDPHEMAMSIGKIFPGF